MSSSMSDISSAATRASASASATAFTTASASATSTDATYDFSIKEATIRNTAIGVCLALFVFVLCALVGLEIMRRRLKRMRKQLLKYMRLEEGFVGSVSTEYPGSARGGGVPMERPASSAAATLARYQLVAHVTREPEREREREPGRQRSMPEMSGPAEVFESDARSVHSFHRGSTPQHNKRVANMWYGLRGPMNGN